MMNDIGYLLHLWPYSIAIVAVTWPIWFIKMANSNYSFEIFVGRILWSLAVCLLLSRAREFGGLAIVTAATAIFVKWLSDVIFERAREFIQIMRIPVKVSLPTEKLGDSDFTAGYNEALRDCGEAIQPAINARRISVDR